MNPHHRLLPRLFLLAALTLLVGLPAQPAQAASEAQEQSTMAVYVLAPLVDIYEGDTITLPYWVEDLAAYGGITLAPLTPSTATVSASLGAATVTAGGLDGTITYTAEQSGREELVLTVSNYFGTLTGSIPLEIKPRPNYDLEFFAVSQDQDAAGGFFLALFTGEGQFAHQPGSPIEGRGRSELWFSLGVNNEVVGCRMDPPIQGTADFTINATENPIVPLVQYPGFQESFFLDLVFAPMPLNATTVVCEGLGGIGLNIPLPATTTDGNELNLTNLHFYKDGGVITLTRPKTSVIISVTRKEP